MSLGPVPLKSRFDVDRPLNSTAWIMWFSQLLDVLIFGKFWKVRTVTGDYTVQKFDGVILLNADATVTLPRLEVGAQKRITVKVINAGAGTRTVSGGGATIDGAASVSTTTRWTAWDFVTDSTGWHIV